MNEDNEIFFCEERGREEDRRAEDENRKEHAHGTPPPRGGGK